MRTALFIFASIASLIALGCFNLLQFGGVGRESALGVALVMYCSAAIFAIANYISAYIKERRNGYRAVAIRGLFLAGSSGLPGLLFFVVVSRGAVLQMSEYVLLLVFFVSTLFLRLLKPRKDS